MKLKALVASIALAYTGVSAQTTIGWETGEYFKSRTLQPINASSAYARGYTGKDSIIAILDSGIDAKSSEFSNRILKVQDFTGQGNITDTIGHGTHVAGIAAAARNGQGVQGVAFDANLIIGKITTNGLVTMPIVNSALQWASQNRADVANLSLNFTLSQTALKAQLVSPGVYKTVFTNTGTLPGGINPLQIASLVPGDMVIVIAAGNDATPWSGGLAQIASAVDSKGNLVLGGRVLVAGNWNSQTNLAVGPNNNGAATLCSVMVGTICQDKYKVSDFYLLAPGTGISSTVPTTVNKAGIATMTGTSMAAPSVSGGVAIIHQMWPQMTGSNIVKLLLVTANKNLPGYSVATMGQGMMDLEKATRPVGQVGIPTTGRLSGQSLTSANPILTTGGSASTGKLGSIMVVDTFERDFYVNSKVLTAYAPANVFNARQAMMPYTSKNNYSLFNNYNNYVNVRSGNFELGVFNNTDNSTTASPSMVEFAYNFGHIRLSGGMFQEYNSWLGNYVNSMTGPGTNNPSATQFMGLGVNQEFGNNLVFANLTHGVTITKAFSDNIKNIKPVLSYSWSVGAEHKLSKDQSIGIMAYQPVSVYRAIAEVTAPVGLDSDFNVIQKSVTNLAADVKEQRLGFYHKSASMMTFIETRQNYRGQQGVKDTAIGFSISRTY